MRIKNKILIEGDTMKIFEAIPLERRKELEQIARKIYNTSGNSDANERLEIMKKMGITDEEEQNEVSVIYNKLWDMEMGSEMPVASDMSMEEGSFNPMKSKKLYYHVLEDGGYGRIGHQGYYNTEAEAKKRAADLQDMFPKSFFYVEAYPSKREPVTVTMESSKMNESLESLSDSELMDLAYDEGMEELIVKNPEGGIENREALIAALNQSNETLNEAKEKKTPAVKKKADKTNYGQKDIADVDMVNPYELKKGIRIEMVDIEDYEKAMDKAVKKLKKDPMFYTNLIANAKETKGKRADVTTEIKDKKLNKVSDKLKDKANEMEVSKKDATKKNANDSLNKKEMAKGKPKGVKEMTMTPKKAKGMKSMDIPGKEKKTKLKESFNLWDMFKRDLLK
jgi:hypothetical protein